MTEEEWLKCTSVRLLLEFLDTRASERKLRLLATYIMGYGVQDRKENATNAAWDTTVQFIEGETDWRTVQLAWWKAKFTSPLTNVFCVYYHSMLREEVTAHAERVQGREQFQSGSVEERKKHVTLVHHLFSNPFRPYPAPASWPSTVVQLAASLYKGQDCRLPLSDALEESGHSELAEHFRNEEVHPKGCYAMDLILGKE